MAIECGNETAFELLMKRPGIRLQGYRVMALPEPLSPPPPEYLKVLLSMYRQLIERDHTLATEGGDYNLVHYAANKARGHYLQWFIDS